LVSQAEKKMPTLKHHSQRNQMVRLGSLFEEKLISLEGLQKSEGPLPEANNTIAHASQYKVETNKDQKSESKETDIPGFGADIRRRSGSCSLSRTAGAREAVGMDLGDPGVSGKSAVDQSPRSVSCHEDMKVKVGREPDSTPGILTQRKGNVLGETKLIAAHL
jgi:hypothetical protein